MACQDGCAVVRGRSQLHKQSALPPAPMRPLSPCCPVLPIADHAGRCAVRQIDRREPLGGPRCLVDVMSRQASSASARSLGPRRRLRVSLNSIDAPASKPHLFAVGGSDPWLRVYDRRMAGSGQAHPKVCAPEAHHVCQTLLAAENQYISQKMASIRGSPCVPRLAMGASSAHDGGGSAGEVEP